ncbi:ESPR-type extended signal peptide-containing protein, partial [Lonepinella sp. BR2919]|uniref:ESPR-type extended signal peptide-containing protein n=1 Tax=unclassified Lonepinella TaxID=2642006 RepID=UPI003F6DBC42
MNHIYKVIWSQVANAFIAVSELASSRGKTNAIKTATPVSSIMNATTQFGLPFKLDKIAALTVLFMSPFYATAADVNADDLTVSGTSEFTGEAKFNGGITTIGSLTVNGTDISNKISTLETDISSKANQTDLMILSDKVDNKADQSDLTILKDTVDTKANKSEVKVLTDTVATKASQTDLNNLNTKVTTLDSTKADKTELNTLNNTVIANKKLFDTLNASVNTLGLTSTYSGIKYFRVKSTAADAQATGDNALAAGPEAIANASKAVAVGHQAHATHENSTALGSNAWATGNNSVATGANTSAKANDSVAVGGNAKVENSAEQGIAIGSDSRVGTKPTGDLAYDGASKVVIEDGESTIAIGDNATGRGNSNIAIGKDALTANKDAETKFATDSIAMGTSARTIASSSAIAIGNKAEVQKSSDSAIAIGDNAKVAATTAVAVGPNTTASGVASTAVGSTTKAVGTNSVAVGANNTTAATSAVAIGDNAQAIARTISIGLNAGQNQEADITETKGSHINIGENSGKDVKGQLNIGIGFDAGSGVVGKANVALGTSAGKNIATSEETLGENVAIGNNANSYSSPTSIQRATAVGSQTKAVDDAVAVGYLANASAKQSIAVGINSQVTGADGVAIGYSAKADANNVALGGASVAKDKSGTGYLTGTSSHLVVSVGDSDKNLLRRIVNVADGADAQDAVTVAQLENVSNKVLADVNAEINKIKVSTTSGINYDVATTPSGGSVDASVTLKNDNGKGTAIHNVAAGTLDTDAVNLAQVNQIVANNMTHYFSVNDGGSKLGNYDNTRASGTLSMAVGQNVTALGDRSVAIGNEANAHGLGSIAIGTYYQGSAELDDGTPQTSQTNAAISNKDYKYGMAIGAGANGEGNNSIAIGSLAATSNKNISVGTVDRAIALGYNAVSSAEKANAIGDRARSSGLTSNAFGSEANATGTSSTAIGTTAQASGTNSIAFGTNQKVSGTNSGSIGYAGDGTTANTTSVSGSGTYSVGNMNSGITAKESGVFGNDNVLKTSDNTRVVGNLNTIGNVTTATPGGATPVNNLKDIYVTGYGNTISSGEKLAEDLSGLFVYGHNNTVAQIDDAASTEKVEITDSSIIGANNTLNTSGSDYFILGNNVTATLQNSVYLGNASAYVASGTSTKGMDSYASIVDNSATYTFAGATPTGVVTVGAVGQERRVQNVAAGLVTSASTDAINGSQLYALTRPLRFAGDNSALSNQDGGNVTQNADTNVISRNSNQAIDITGGETDASKLTTKTDKNIGVIVTDNNSMEIRLAKELTNLTNATFGTGSDSTVINKDGVTITNGGTTVKLTEAGLDNGNNKIINVSPGVSGTDAVNVNQLEAVNATANAGWKLQANGSDQSTVKPNATVSLNNTDNNIVISKNAADNNVTFGLNSTVTVKGSGAGKVTLDGSNGTISLADKDGSSNTTIAVTNSGAKDLDGKEITRITYNTTVGGNTVIEQIATLNDGLYFEGDTGTKVTRKLTQTLNISGGATGSVAANNIKVTSDNDSGSLLVQLAKDLNLTDTGSLTIGDTVLNSTGLTINNGPSVTKTGINAGGEQITNVKAGSADTDAVNVSQLKVVNATANAGWKLQANGNDESTVKPNATVSLNNTDNNIVISKNAADNNVTFGLNSTVIVKGSSGAGKVTLDGTNGTVNITNIDGSNA